MLKFIERVVGVSDGAMVITSPPHHGAKGWLEVWSDDSGFQHIEEPTARFGKQELGTYFSLGRFGTDDSGKHRRRQSQCKSLKSFWFDIDAGADKFARHPDHAYESQEEAVVALVDFVKASTIPKPTYIVSSGEGLHVLWVTDTHMPVAEWKEAANKFGAVAKDFGLKLDEGCISNAAGAPRVPGSLHKSGRPVEILREDPADINAAEFLEKIDFIIEAREIEVHVKQVRERDENQEYPVTFFQKIIDLGITGCAQLNYAYENQDRIPEPLWWGALTIAEFCEDRAEWIHKLSDQHPGYSWDNTEAKAAHSKGPRSCSWFASENPKGCEGCLHRGKFGNNGSPINLGLADPEPTEVVVPMTLFDGEVVDVKYEIPVYPEPFRRAADGGIVTQRKVEVMDEKGTKSKITVDHKFYNYDFYLYDRIGKNDGGKPQFWARHHSPNDGVVQFQLDSDVIAADVSRVKVLLSAHSIWMVDDEDYRDMSKYLRASAAKLQQARAERVAPQQLGWTKRDTFVLGPREYGETGHEPAPVAASEKAQLFAASTPATLPQLGSAEEAAHIDEWSATLQELYGAPEAKIHRMMLAMAIGAPIRSRHGNEKGGMVNLFTEGSGTGKTTLIMNSLGYFVDAEDLAVYGKAGATFYAFFQLVAYANSIPLLYDEIGQLCRQQTADILMEIIHQTTSGNSKLQGASGAADIRKRSDGWRSFTFSTSNVSLWNYIASSRVENEAYLMRVVEIPLPTVQAIQENKTRGDALRRKAKTLMGCCGPRLISYMLQHDEFLKSRWIESSAMLDREAGLEIKQRFWGDILNSAIVGAEVGRATGTFPFDPEEVKQTVIEELRRLTNRAETKVVQDDFLLGEFLNDYRRHQCILDSDTWSPTRNVPPDTTHIRVEIHNKKVWITYSSLADWSIKKGVDVGRLEEILVGLGAQRDCKKRMLAHTPAAPGQNSMRTWCIDATNPKAAALFDMKSFAELLAGEGES